MTFQALLDLLYQAMQPTFTVFGVTVNLWSLFVFSVIFSVLAWFLRNLFGGGDS